MFWLIKIFKTLGNTLFNKRTDSLIKNESVSSMENMNISESQEKRERTEIHTDSSLNNNFDQNLEPNWLKTYLQFNNKNPNDQKRICNRLTGKHELIQSLSEQFLVFESLNHPVDFDSVILLDYQNDTCCKSSDKSVSKFNCSDSEKIILRIILVSVFRNIRQKNLSSKNYEQSNQVVWLGSIERLFRQQIQVWKTESFSQEKILDNSSVITLLTAIDSLLADCYRSGTEATVNCLNYHNRAADLIPALRGLHFPAVLNTDIYTEDLDLFSRSSKDKFRDSEPENNSKIRILQTDTDHSIILWLYNNPSSIWYSLLGWINSFNPVSLGFEKPDEYCLPVRFSDLQTGLEIFNKLLNNLLIPNQTPEYISSEKDNHEFDHQFWFAEDCTEISLMKSNSFNLHDFRFEELIYDELPAFEWPALFFSKMFNEARKLTASDRFEYQSSFLSTDKVQVSEYSNKLAKRIYDYYRTDLLKLIEKDNAFELEQRLRNGIYLGVDLLPILNNQEKEDFIHNKADDAFTKLLKRLDSPVNCYPIIAVSLSLIAARNYNDGTFYEFTESKYQKTYSVRNKQLIQNTIRDIAEYYSGNREIQYFVRQAMFPEAYLEDIIKMANTIYQNDYKYDIPCNPVESLVMEFRYIHSSFDEIGRKSKNSLGLSNKISVIKQLFQNESHYPELIDYFVILIKNVDTYYWNKDQKLPSYNNYFMKHFADTDFDQLIPFRTRSSGSGPSLPRKRQQKDALFLQNGIVILKIKEIDLDEYNPEDNIVIQVKNGNQVTKEITSFNILNESERVYIDSVTVRIGNPLEFLSVDIINRNNGEIIYTTGRTLYRPFLVFKENGKEANSEYLPEGIYSIAVHNGTDLPDQEAVYNFENYQVYELNLSSENPLAKINDLILKAGKRESLEIVGEVNKDILVSSGNRNYPVYRTVSKIMYNTLHYLTDDLFLILDNSERIRYFDESCQQNGLTCLSYSLSSGLQPGLHTVSVKSRSNSKTVGSSSFFIGNISDINIQRNKSMYSILMISDFIGEQDEDAPEDRIIADYLNLNSENIFPLEITDPNFKQNLQIHVNLSKNFYRISQESIFSCLEDSPWRRTNTDLLRSELDYDSRIYFEGVELDEVSVVSGSECLTTIEIEKDGFGKKWISAQLLMNLHFNGTKLHLKLMSEGKCVDFIEYYLKSQFTLSDSYYDRDSGMGHIQFTAKGPDSIDIDILRGPQLVYSNQFGLSDFHQKQEIQFEAEPSTDYFLRVTSVSEDLFSAGEFYLIEKNILKFPEIDFRHMQLFEPQKIKVDGGETWNIEGSKSRIYVDKSVKPHLWNGFLVTENGNNKVHQEEIHEVTLYCPKKDLEQISKVCLSSSEPDFDVLYNIEKSHLAVDDISQNCNWGEKYIHFSDLTIRKIS